ncbi:hypothetical protein GDO78_013518 [Eleutherodactylus coqui]|uniref:Uncharacterized protein n=1 Tax=Eleutherodactylus coqui TaxID=57060 RepID=A0A8J6F1K0_ELECQ|nr:hypothetical protein GDO78_013518 [Eleutherodactylus coqui]
MHFLLFDHHSSFHSNPFKSLRRADISTKSYIYYTYSILLNPYPNQSIRSPYKHKSEVMWRITQKQTSKTSICSSKKENQYKLLTFW